MTGGCGLRAAGTVANPNVGTFSREAHGDGPTNS
jgi:hypothetical protein